MGSIPACCSLRTTDAYSAGPTSISPHNWRASAASGLLHYIPKRYLVSRMVRRRVCGMATPGRYEMLDAALSVFIIVVRGS